MPVRLWKPDALNWKQRAGKWYFETTVGDPLGLPGARGFPAGYDYQWLANGIPILGAAGPLYEPTEADIGKILTLELTARKPRE